MKYPTLRALLDAASGNYLLPIELPKYGLPDADQLVMGSSPGTDDAFIATHERVQNFHESVAHLCADGNVYRFGNVIAHWTDIVVKEAK